MARPWRVDMEVKGFREMKQKLTEEPSFMAPAWANFMDGLGKAAKVEADRSSPRGPTGKLASSNSYAVQKKPFPTWARVKNTARAQGKPAVRQSKAARAGKRPLRLTKGYPYPGRLNWERKNPRYGWFTKAMERAKSGAQPLLAQTAREIEQSWRQQ